MSRPLPRWFRHRCPHDNRVEVTAGGGVISDYCQDCKTDFLAALAPEPRGYTTAEDIMESAGIKRPEGRR